MKSDITSRYSCKRKKDFITFTAVIMFTAIVVFELYLVFWLPVQLRRENAMQKHVARQRITELADALRYQCNTSKKTTLQKGEIELIRSSLDILAIYMRENQEKLSMAQIKELDALLMRISAIVNSWNTNRYFIERETFDTTPIIKALETKLDALDKKQFN